MAIANYAVIQGVVVENTIVADLDSFTPPKDWVLVEITASLIQQFGAISSGWSASEANGSWSFAPPSGSPGA